MPETMRPKARVLALISVLPGGWVGWGLRRELYCDGSLEWLSVQHALEETAQLRAAVDSSC
jgi:hypothetical protein